MRTNDSTIVEATAGRAAIERWEGEGGAALTPLELLSAQPPDKPEQLSSASPHARSTRESHESPA